MYNELVIRMADRILNETELEYHMKIEVFDWVPGVGLYGLFKAYKETGERRYLNFINDWFTRHLHKAYVQKTVNSTAPLLTAVLLYEETGEEKLMNVCADIADYIVRNAPLTREGGLEHTVIDDVERFAEEIWADTLFMACLFLAKYGKTVRKRDYIDFSAKQLLTHYRLLQDTGSGLCYHGWSCEAQNHLSAVRWGRANAWIVFACAEILQLAGEFDGREVVLKFFNRHIVAITDFQREDGLFGTILDDPSAYSEISASAGIAAGIRNAVKYRLIDKKYLSVYEKVQKRLSDYIAPDGSVLNVSGGTPIMPTAEDYKKIPFHTALYGQSFAILALCGVSD